MNWTMQKPAIPPVEGWYRVMHSGDSDYWQPADPEELEDFDGGYKGSWQTMHDEEGDFIFAYAGPVPTPEPFHMARRRGAVEEAA